VPPSRFSVEVLQEEVTGGWVTAGLVQQFDRPETGATRNVDIAVLQF